MLLKSVELFGFKSFADRTVIDFSEGISALLGPNGCGKSNVVDAIKWVLGEQSTKTLRAEKMEDVIFNGTENRKALGIAEVSLLISNETGILELDMPEISVKRRLYRSGESEYYINGAIVKLKELRELFLDTGIGKSAYSIMEQGKIDQILSSKPEERRYLFEEAAGITKYKMRGAEAERKLSRTEENMRQVDSILSEVKRSYETLKTQAEKTAKYRELKDEIFNDELNLQLLRLRGVMETLNNYEENLAKKDRDKKKITDQINEINESLEENLDLVNSMESDLIESRKKLYGMDLEKDGKDSQGRILLERRSEISSQADNCVVKEKKIKERIVKLKEQRKDLNTEIERALLQVKDTQSNIEAFQENINIATNRITENNNNIAKFEKLSEESELAQIGLQEELRQITDDIVSQLDEKLRETGYSYSERKNAENDFIALIKRTKIFFDGKKKIFDDILQTSATEKSKEIIEVAEILASKGMKRIVEIEDAFSLYTKTIPGFIDDFLAPEGTIVKKRNIDQSINEHRESILSSRKNIKDLRKENIKLNKRIDEYRKTLEELKLTKVRMESKYNSLQESLKRIELESDDQQKRLVENSSDLETFNFRLKDIAKQLEQIENEKLAIKEKKERLQKELSRLEKNISRKNDTMKSREKKVKSMIGSLGKIQHQIESLHINISNTKVEIRNIYENFKDKHSRDLSDYDSKMYELPGEMREYREKLSKKRDALRALGSVNLMAPEEFEEVKERYDFLNNQIKDLDQAREDLKQITGQIRKESTELFIETYNKIKKNFHIMFRRLFGGGRAEFKLLEPDNLLTTGIEIYAQPPGKKLENIALLSGGERSLTAVGLLFATYMVKPSPFCILDEIDAALDEANVGRFVNMLMEFGKKSQFIVITHNKKTVTGANTLLGVTMQESGVSKTVTIRLDNKNEESGDSLPG